MNSLKMKIKIDITYFILTLSAAYCDVQRTEDGSFLEDFMVVNKGHMHYPTILMFMEELDIGACADTCRRHLSCVTFNYNWITHACELVDRRFDEGEAVFDEPGWYNFGTPAKIDGGWSNWKKTPCSVICGKGTITKYRTCAAPEPKYGGAPCIGREAHAMSCEMQPCVPINGGLSDWVNDGKCSVTCGVGQQFQIKTCTNPPPQYGGKDCTTTPKRSITCNNQNCRRKCARRCNLMFTSRYELTAHKKLSGHLRGKKGKHVDVEPDQQSILAMLAHQEDEDDDGHLCKPGPGGDENTCPRCQGIYQPGSGDWLKCSVCHFWFNEVCF